MFRTLSLVVGIALIVNCLFVFGAFGAPPIVGTAQDDVKQVYLNKCSVCHGEDGAAKTAKGKKLKMKDIRAADVQKLTPAQWTETILKGDGKDMDSFEKELGADMARKLAAYMRDLSKK